MTSEQLLQLKQMTRTAIGLRYMKERAFNKITEDQYRWLILQGIDDTKVEPEPLPEPPVTSESEREGMSVEEIEEAFNPSNGKSQKEKLLSLLLDGQYHTTVEIRNRVYGSTSMSISRVAARIDDLRKDGHDIPKAVLDHDKIYKYKLIV